MLCLVFAWLRFTLQFFAYLLACGYGGNGSIRMTCKEPRLRSQLHSCSYLHFGVRLVFLGIYASFAGVCLVVTRMQSSDICYSLMI